ncbi:GFA family protein [Halomonas sp. C05BenzN]|uniref:GFA family protein n=1 Tax=Halomonas sp. C05BenzN TaxID=3411041 RepID=UPI003B95C055
MSNGPFYQGGCRCGAVTLMTCHAPLATGHCDCATCREVVGARQRVLLLWPADQLQLATGVDELVSSRIPGGGVAYHCGRCGDSVLAEYPEEALVELGAETIPDVPLEPGSDDTQEALFVRLGHRPIVEP